MKVMLPIFHIEETDSTNNYLKDLLLKDRVEEGAVVVTDYQTSGKGQRGNGWESERSKNLLFSIVLYPDIVKANEQFIISEAVSLAVKEFLSKYADDITVKWPNDIYWQEKKICGILIENTLQEDRIGQSVIGIGININQEKFESNAPNPVSLRQITGKEYNLSILLDEVVKLILDNYNRLKSGEKLKIQNSYKDSLFRKVGYHKYSDGTSEFWGKIKDVEDSGILVLETDKEEVRKFAFKEVKYCMNQPKY